MMRSEGSATTYVGGSEARGLPVGPVVHKGPPVIPPGRVFVPDLLPDLAPVPEPSLSADLEASCCGRLPGEPGETFPDYALAIARVMRDSEGHHRVAVRAARKDVVTALQGLHRVLTSPASVEPDGQVRRSVKDSTRGRAAGGRARSEALAGRDIRSIRVWARENGVECPARGRFLPAAVLEAYDRAHG